LGNVEQAWIKLVSRFNFPHSTPGTCGGYECEFRFKAPD
jgi:hypothetical protein